MSSPIRVKQIDHVTLVVRDLEASAAFYVDLLGMEQVPRPGFRFAGRWFQAGSTQIHLIEQHADSGPPQAIIPEGAKVSRTKHVAFEVADALQAHAALIASGWSIAAGPQQRPDGPTQVYVLDPDGHLIELFSQPSA